MTDNLTAALDEIRERDRVIWSDKDTRVSSSAAADAARSAVPRLLAALDEVLKLHIPETVDGIRPFRCCSYCSGRPAWPCPTVQAISRSLLGKESDRA